MKAKGVFLDENIQQSCKELLFKCEGLDGLYKGGKKILSLFYCADGENEKKDRLGEVINLLCELSGCHPVMLLSFYLKFKDTKHCC